MKVLLEIATVFLLIAVGWQQSFRDHWRRITGDPPPPQVRTQIKAAPARPAAPSGSSAWMWSPTKLDPR